MDYLIKKVQETFQEIESEVSNVIDEGKQSTQSSHNVQNQYGSFAPQRDGNDVKWYVDGCGYMWAVSKALEQAKESIWILDWWLSPELYLRRPPSRNEKYRLDRMLQAAAKRGVKVNIIVYKEVTQALTRKYLSPTIPKYLRSLLPRHTDPITKLLSGLGIAATFAALEKQEAETPLISPPVTVSSSHTKHALEDLDPNISVFRHPDHLPDVQTLQSSFISSLQNLSLTAATVANLPGDALKAIYGMNEDVILYWAHHEKLCIVDGKTTFMGGLDLCYGRWDTNQHPIADAHPSNLEDIVFPGQDFNNARIMDFADVAHWENNKLDRKNSSRMGWSDISISLHGPVVHDLREHFVQRWNFIYNEKYDVRGDERYSRLSMTQAPSSNVTQNLEQSSQPPQFYNQGKTPEMYFPPPPVSDRGLADTTNSQYSSTEQPSHQSHHSQHHHLNHLEERFQQGMQHVQDEYLGSSHPGGVRCQLVRSCTKWSHGVPIEHSIANAYISVIQNSQHFVYIENQFFITVTSDSQKPVRNKIGAAIVERILRAARAGEKYKVIVVMPAIPAFAGDLQDDSSLGTRAIMEYQYNSINRGGHSIMESIANAGFEPTDYIRFYNLRNYDRINASASMREAERQSGVNYEDAREKHDDMVDHVGFRAQGGVRSGNDLLSSQGYQRYQQAAHDISERNGLGNGRWDSVSECYMLGGRDIRDVPWENGDLNEIEAFVSEELYIHSKVLIADDRIVICGSANLNDRSQLGDHDSEIALIIQDPTPLASFMNGQPWQASKLATTLRRQLFRKHLGLLPPQNMEHPDANFDPVGFSPNTYDFGSPEDSAVTDPLSPTFLNLWNTRAKANTDIFGRVFHPVPHDSVRTWKDYDAFYERFFHEADKEADGKLKPGANQTPAKYMWGHVVAEDFSPGEEGVREVKELLSGVRGTLVEMPLLFLIKEDIAREGLSLNGLTEVIYT